MNENKKDNSLIKLIIIAIILTVAFIGGMLALPKPKNDKVKDDYGVDIKALYGTEWTRYLSQNRYGYLVFDKEGNFHYEEVNESSSTQTSGHYGDLSFVPDTLNSETDYGFQLCFDNVTVVNGGGKSYDGYLDGDKAVIVSDENGKITPQYGTIPFVGGKTLIIEGSFIGGTYQRKEEQ